MTTQRSRSVASYTLTGRLRRTRGLLVFVALAAGVPLLQFQVLPLFVKVVGGADNRWFVDERFVLISASPLLPGSRAGDRLVALNGRALEPLGTGWNELQTTPPGPVIVQLARAGAMIVVHTTLPPKETALVVALWLRYATGVLLLLIGLGAFLGSPGRTETWLFLLFCYALGIAVHLEFIAWSDTVIFAVQWVVLPLAAGLGVHLFTRYPDPVPFFRHHRWRTALLYLPSAVLTPLAELRFVFGLEWPPGVIATSAIWVVPPAWAILGGAFVVQSYLRVRRSSEPGAVSLYRALLVSVSGLLVPAVLTAIMRLFDVLPNERWIWQSSIATLVLFAGMTAYTLVRHNTLQVDRFTAAVLGYALTIGLVGLGFVAVLLALSRALDQSGTRSPSVYVVLTAAATLSISPLYRHVKRRVDRLFFRDAADPTRSMRLLQQLVNAIAGKGREEALDLALASLGALQPDGIALWALADNGKHFTRVRATEEVTRTVAQSVSRSGALGQAMQRGEQGGVEALVGHELPPDAQEELWSLNLAMAVPVRAHGALMGFLAVGRKRSGTAYLDTDLLFLDAVAAQVATILSRPTEGSQLGRYRIERRLGVGGMAEVFLAWQLGPGGFERRVALKRPLPELSEDPTCAAMFLDEARISSQLHHRNIAQLYEIDRHQGAYYIAMEYVDGPSLRTALKVASQAGLSPPAPVGLSIAGGILSALAHAHRATDGSGARLQLVHRDVTPANVLLSSEGEVKLVDFGIARAGARIYKTQTGNVRGTIPYMSPEHALGTPLDARADQYSAAAVIYELFTLARAFPDGPVGRRPPPPSSLRPGLPAGLDGVLAKAFAFDRDQRYESVDALRVALLETFAPILPAGEAEIIAWLRTLPRDLLTVSAPTAPPEPLGVSVSEGTAVMEPSSVVLAPPSTVSTATAQPLEPGAGTGAATGDLASRAPRRV